MTMAFSELNGTGGMNAVVPLKVDAGAPVKIVGGRRRRSNRRRTGGRKNRRSRKNRSRRRR